MDMKPNETVNGLHGLLSVYRLESQVYLAVSRHQTSSQLCEKSYSHVNTFVNDIL